MAFKKKILDELKTFLPNGDDVITYQQTDKDFPPNLNKFIVLQIFQDIFLTQTYDKSAKPSYFNLDLLI